MTSADYILMAPRPLTKLEGALLRRARPSVEGEDDRVVKCSGRRDPSSGGEVGEQALETVHRQAVVGIYLGHKEVRYGGNSYTSRSRYAGGGVSASGHRRQDLRTGRRCGRKRHGRRLHLQPLPLCQKR